MIEIHKKYGMYINSIYIEEIRAKWAIYKIWRQPMLLLYTEEQVGNTQKSLTNSLYVNELKMDSALSFHFTEEEIFIIIRHIIYTILYHLFTINWLQR